MSSAALRPSVEIFSMLSSSGVTARERTRSARSPRPLTYVEISGEAGIRIVCGARAPSGRAAILGVGSLSSFFWS